MKNKEMTLKRLIEIFTKTELLNTDRLSSVVDKNEEDQIIDLAVQGATIKHVVYPLFEALMKMTRLTAPKSVQRIRKKRNKKRKNDEQRKGWNG